MRTNQPAEPFVTRALLFELAVLAASLSAVTLSPFAFLPAVVAWIVLNALALWLWTTLDAASKRAGLVLQTSLALFAFITTYAIKTGMLLDNPVAFALALLVTFGLSLLARRLFVPNQTSATILALANNYVVVQTQPSLATDLPAGLYAVAASHAQTNRNGGKPHKLKTGQTVSVHVQPHFGKAPTLTLLEN